MYETTTIVNLHTGTTHIRRDAHSTLCGIKLYVSTHFGLESNTPSGITCKSCLRIARNEPNNMHTNEWHPGSCGWHVTELNNAICHMKNTITEQLLTDIHTLWTWLKNHFT